MSTDGIDGIDRRRDVHDGGLPGDDVGADGVDDVYGVVHLTQADVDAGQVDNTATVTGTDPNATDVTDTDTESVSIPAAPAITLVKTGR
ncbi:hypothetical protein [Nocardioides sp.]|uniref:DUF7507 domain-containing protein n=1 Tax=Nocardioides sp. TaxID=35761 RepID=UPI003529660C